MAKHGKKYLNASKLFDRDTYYAPEQAVELVKQISYPKFDGTVEVHVRLGVDPRHADQQVRSTVLLPAGLGKTVRILVFAEGDAQLRQTCSDRYSLSPCKTLVIWTAPPGRLELTAILAASHPQEVVWYGYDTVAYQPAAFLSHLARLVNFRLAHRQGRVLAAELASATAQRDSAIRRGIAWLCGEGHYSIVDEDALGWILSAGGEHNQAVSDKMKREVSYLLAETAAFRAFCRQGDLSSLIRRS